MQSIVKEQNSYAINFDGHFSLDWGWTDKRRGWTYSEHDGAKWDTHYLAMRKVDVKQLLNHFGLTGYRDVPEYEILRFMSPCELFRLRKKREQEEQLSSFEPVSDRLGGHISALLVA